eukprot:1160118-Pelagomonas_calceolata.AAC.5
MTLQHDAHDSAGQSSMVRTTLQQWESEDGATSGGGRFALKESFSPAGGLRCVVPGGLVVPSHICATHSVVMRRIFFTCEAPVRGMPLSLEDVRNKKPIVLINQPALHRDSVYSKKAQ